MSEASADRGREIALVLISHTNVGKTSLARTLLREDIGEVVDDTHTTMVNTRHELIVDGEDRLVLWDTPGFGDSARLKQRLEANDRPLTGLLTSTWDRLTDRTNWCAQQAMRAVRDDGDLVLYLVNASEDPEFATYIDVELSILAWLQTPVLVLLNQLPGPDRPAARSARLDAWRAALDREPVRDVLALDAFQRHWLEEGRLLARVQHAISHRAPMPQLVDAWRRRQRTRFDTGLAAAASTLAATVTDREPLGSGQRRRPARAAALKRLAGRLAARTAALDAQLIDLEALEGSALEALQTDLGATRSHGERPTPEAGAAGGAVLGAGAGAALDLLFGGLTFGVFTALGASLSGAAAWRWCWQALDATTLGWSEAFVADVARELAARSLAISHHGRARGPFDANAVGSWRTAVDAAPVAAPHADETSSSDPPADLSADPNAGPSADLSALHAQLGSGDAAAAHAAAQRLLHSYIVAVLRTQYPQAADLLEEPAHP